MRDEDISPLWHDFMGSVQSIVEETVGDERDTSLIYGEVVEILFATDIMTEIVPSLAYAITQAILRDREIKAEREREAQASRPAWSYGREPFYN